MKRAEVLNALRAFFWGQDFLEVETPIRVPAILPETHIDAFESEDQYLQTSPESCMKRLIAAGYPKIFQIAKVFRNGEHGEKHLPEFTMLEWYRKNASYLDLMEDCESFISAMAETLGVQAVKGPGGREVTLEKPWQRLTVAQAFLLYGSITLDEALLKDTFDEVMAFDIEPKLGELNHPVFLTDYPAAHGAFAARKPENLNLAERFELYIAGLELVNAFTEITDVHAIKARFLEEAKNRARLKKKPYPEDVKYLEALKDLPPCAGGALGVDRLVMLFCGAKDIKLITAFTPEDFI